MTEEPSGDSLLLELILVFQQTAWLGLGKIQDPTTGKSELNLPQASHAIDMLAMLQRKTEGNRSEQESGLLSNALTQLRLNYVEAAGASSAEPAGKEADAQESGSEKPDSSTDS